MKKEKSEGKLKLTKEQEEEVIKKGVMAMTKIIERLAEENKKLKEDVDYRHHRCMVAERGGEDED